MAIFLFVFFRFIYLFIYLFILLIDWLIEWLIDWLIESIYFLDAIVFPSLYFLNVFTVIVSFDFVT